MAKKVDHTHGDNGTKPADNLNFERADKPDPEVFDWFWSEVPAAINDHADELDAIDADDDGTVDSAETAAKLKGNDIDSDGDGVVDKADEVVNGSVPTGGIMMWSGSTTNVPSGWTLCDGTDGAPDLRNRFIAGAGDEYSVGDTGGEKEHTLTESEMPSHVHSYNETNTKNSTSGDEGFNSSHNSGTTESTTDTTGGDQPHENRPRFYSLAYIYKL